MFEVMGVADYKTMYYRLTGKIADAVDILIEVQQESEEMAMKDDVVIRLLDMEDEE